MLQYNHYFILWVHHILFIYELTMSWLFPLLAVINNAVWTLMYEFLWRQMFSFPLGIYLGVELLGHPGSLCFTFWNNLSVSVCSHSHQCVLLAVFFITALPVGVKWYLTVLLIYILSPFWDCILSTLLEHLMLTYYSSHSTLVLISALQLNILNPQLVFVFSVIFWLNNTHHLEDSSQRARVGGITQALAHLTLLVGWILAKQVSWMWYSWLTLDFLMTMEL